MSVHSEGTSRKGFIRNTGGRHESAGDDKEELENTAREETVGKRANARHADDYG